MRAAFALIVAAGLAGCSLFGSDAPKPPPLPEMTGGTTARLLWSSKIDRVDLPLTIAAVGDQFVVADTAGQVRALRAGDGQELWRADLGTKLAAGVGSDGRFAAVVTRDQELVVLDAGKPAWRARLRSPVLAAPLVAGERVFVLGVDRVVYGFDALDGRRIWELRRPGDALLLSHPGGLAVFKDTLVVGQGPRLAGVDPTRGTLRWEANVASPRGTNEVERLADVVAPLARSGELLCARAFQSAVGCVNAARGSQVWSRPNAGAVGVSADATAVVGFDGSDRLTAWRTTNGETLWTHEALQHRKLAAPLLVGTHVVMGDGDGLVHVLDRDSGKTRTRLQTGSSRIVTAPVQTGGVMLVAAQDGGLHALKIE